MDVNVTTDVKVYGAPPVSAVELEDAQKPSVPPVQEGSEAVTVKLNDRALHGKGEKEEQQKKGELTKEDIEEAVKDIDKRLASMGSAFRFGYFSHLETKSIVGQLRDKKTDKVIKQFPSEEVLKLREKLQDLIGLLFDEKV
ncbi:MAG: flagellar protein FlaG [Deltaproteobacteria bacterium]|nr:flagellar protein FlaG [Deltaproteobacteria bacterium]